jgi:hypothetical protein
MRIEEEAATSRMRMAARADIVQMDYSREFVDA